MAKKKTNSFLLSFRQSNAMLAVVMLVIGALGSYLVFGASAAPQTSAPKTHCPSGDYCNLSLVMVTDNNGNGLPNYGDIITFNVQTNATVQPFVGLNCYQNGVN